MRIFPDVDTHLLETALSMARTLPQEVFDGWMLALASHNAHLSTTLLQEIRRMATNDAALTQAVQDLLDAYQANTTALEAEIDAMKTRGLDGADPAITASVSKIENIVAQMKQSTADAQSAIAPPPANPVGGTDSGSAVPPSSSAGDSAAGTGSSPAGSEGSPAGSSSSTDDAGSATGSATAAAN